MRRRLATALTITAALVLAGCSGGDAEPEPSPSASEGAAEEAPEATEEDVAALEGVVAEGDLGAAPTLTFEQPFAVSAPVARVDVEGSGDEIAEDQTVTIQYVAVSGDDGTVLGSTWESDAAESLALSDPTLLDALREAIVGQSVGVRVLFAAPGGEATETSEAYPATLMAIEVTDARTVPTRAEGEAVEPPAGLPEVTLADDGAPSIEIPEDAEEPTTTVGQTLIQGSGAAVEAGQTVTVQYTGWTWDGEQFDSSWERQPFTTQLSEQAVIGGWVDGLAGKTVGSQVLLVIPSDRGYGAEGTPDGSIPPDSTLVFVVDILDATP